MSEVPTGPLLGRTILLCGNFGFNNLGDDTILDVLVKHLRQQGAAPVVLAGDPAAVSQRWGVQAVFWQDWPAIWQALAACDAVVVGGGGLFQEYWGTDLETLFSPRHHSLTYYCGIAFAAQLLGVPYLFHGIGAGPLASPTGKELVRSALAGAARISLRDPGSLQSLQAAGIAAQRAVVSADLAAVAFESPWRKKRPEKPHLVVNLRPWPLWPAFEASLDRLAAHIAELARPQQAQISLVAFTRGPDSHHSDEVLMQAFRLRLHDQGLQQVELITPEKLDDAQRVFARAHGALVMRYHAALFAAFAGIPFVAVAYDPKVDHLLQQLQLQEAGLHLPELGSHRSLRLLEAALSGTLPSIRPGVREQLRRHAQADLEQLIGQLSRIPPSYAHHRVLGAKALAHLAAEAAAPAQGGEALRLVEAEREALARKAARLHEQVVRLEKELTATRAEHEQLVASYAARQQEVEKLSQELAATRAEHQQLIAAYGERQNEVERLAGELQNICATKWFKLASFYWRLTQRLRGRGHRNETDTGQSLPTPPAQPTPPPSPATDAAPDASVETPVPSHTRGAGNFDVLMLPIIEWDFRFQRPQQLARHLARRGHRVFYLAHRTASKLEVKKKEPGVFEVRLSGKQKNVYQEGLDGDTCRSYLQAVEQLRRHWHMGAACVVVQLPFWWPLARALRQGFGWPVMYDCMDFHAGFSTNDDAMLRQEEELLAGADCVVVSAQALEEQARSRNRRVVRVPNACDYAHFAQVPWRAPSQTPVVGYYGAIADWFDSDLVADLAQLRPQWEFLLVGSTFTADTRRLKCLPNIRLVGEKPYGELPRWIQEMDVLLIPFKRNPLTHATNPVKFYEIMAAGKPLISVPLPELLPHEDLVFFAETPEKFASSIERILLQEKPEKAEARRAFARQQTWDARALTFEQAASASFPLASVIVVTHGNLHLTRRCLESVLQGTDWPNLELWVVDNASSDGTPDYLSQLATTDPRVHVILNRENLGFAAANNQALRQAQGDFLVLLNNDTVVPPTWLSRLIAHLVAHPEWGLVGPVTNWIGNEAQIPVGYRRLEEMPQWAEEHMERMDGRWLPIPVLAMFCVAMRREVFLQVGELDERFTVGMFEDDDYALRVRQAGLEVVCVEDVFVHHEGKAAFKKLAPQAYQEIFETNRRRFEEKWQRPWIPHRYRSA